MEEYLYRYISFEAFVGMVQSQALTFVLPELWEDPKEGAPFQQLLEQLDSVYEKAMLYSVYCKTYGQCWTKLPESDAMWRIYSFNNRAIQIEASVKQLAKLPNITILPVEYMNEIQFGPAQGIDAFLKSMAIKRCAFEHEKEVRLINYYKFLDNDDLERHIKAVLAISEHPQRIEIIESLFPCQSLEERIAGVVELLNVGSTRKSTLDVSFAHIPALISGVKVHPLAPSWFVSIVKEFCKRNSVPFEGKSTLYAKD